VRREVTDIKAKNAVIQKPEDADKWMDQYPKDKTPLYLQVVIDDVKFYVLDLRFLDFSFLKREAMGDGFEKVARQHLSPPKLRGGLPPPFLPEAIGKNCAHIGSASKNIVRELPIDA
jgi:hypothetical protein